MFLNPNLLWLLVVPTGLAIYQLRRASAATIRRNVATAGLRLLALSMLILALAQPIYTTGKTDEMTIAVIDCSASMRTEDLEAASLGLRSLVETVGRENIRLIVFGAVAREVELDDEILKPGGLVKLHFSQAGSNIGAALELAASLSAEDSQCVLHLFSDGRETHGDMLRAAHRIGRRNFKLVIHEIGAVADESALLVGVRSASSAVVGEAIPLTVRVDAQSPVDANVNVFDQDGRIVGSRSVSLRAGIQEVDVFVRLVKVGRQAFRVNLDGSDQMVQAGLNVVDMIIGVIESAPEAPAANVLRSLLGGEAKVLSLKPAELNRETWKGMDVLVLADTPAAEIPEAAQKELKAWVEQGGGLLVAGGRNAFGPGGYAHCQFADALPLRFPQKKEARDPSTALAILIDTSVSMKTSGVNLAKEIARLALKRLKPHDKAGIVEFYGTKRWAAPMQSAANHIGLQRALNRLSPGGGTQLLPGLTEAYYGLVNVNTRTKHILLLTDGGVERGAYAPLLNRMVEDGIQLSTVTVGPRASSTFLAQLARQGRGQFYTAPNRFKLPEVIVKQPSSSLLNPFVEETVRLRSGSTSRLLNDLAFDKAPALQGYVRTTPKKTAEVLLRSEMGDPILARWNYGLGRVAAFTTQIGGEWAGDFAEWPATPHLMANLLRQLRGVSPKEKLALTLSSGSSGLAVDIRALSADPSLTMQRLNVDVADSSGKVIAGKNVLPTEANTWQAVFVGLPAGQYTVDVRTAAGAQPMGSGEIIIPPPNEITRIAPDKEKLAAASRIASAQALQVDSAAPAVWRELWPLCVVSGLLCFLLMILVRRLPKTIVGRRPATARQLALVVAVGLSTLTNGLLAQELQDLSPSERHRIDTIIHMKPDVARNEMKEECRRLIKRHGDLQRVCEYLKSGKITPTKTQLLALVALENGDLTLAQATLADSTDRTPADLWAMTQLARIHDMQGQPVDALRVLKQCLASVDDPAMKFALLVRRIQLLYSENQLDAAHADIRKILEQPGFEGQGVRNYCARIAGLWGDFAMVEELFVPVGEGRKLMRDLLYFGQILLQRGNPQKARDVFAQALTAAKTGNDRRYALDRLVTASRETGTLEKLIDEWKRDANLQPEQLMIMVGVLSGELDRVKDVLPILDRVDLPEKTRTVIESAEFQTRVLMELLAAGHSELVQRKYNELIAKNPQNYFLHEGYARLLLTEGKRVEAVDFFQKTVALEKNAGGLMRLARAARGLSMHHVAVAAAEKAASVSEGSGIQARLFVVEQHRLMGRADEALKTLQAIEAETAGDPKMVGLLAEAYEKNGRPKDSIRLYRAAYDKTRDEELLKRLLSVGDVSRQPDKGFALWRELWENASEQMTVVQAQDRMLALGAETGMLADIAIEFEERLDDGQLSERELTMLLEIYSSANDPVSAADILAELARRNDTDIVDTYRKMVRVYMECELFGRCTAILRKLIKRDPENSDEYLRSLALIALERQSSGDAAAVLGELASRSESGVLDDTFSAGILSMIGRRGEAAHAYRRALAANPDEAENWLLWANAEKELGAAGKRRAIARLSLLMEESEDNDLFTIAVDGLLNVGANRSVLSAALRRVYERIANQPHKRFLYRIAADLNDELRQQQEAGRILEQSLAVTDEGREIVLRELMAIARVKNSMDDVVRHSRSLLNTASGVPPDECLELGTILLGRGYLSEADNAFLRITTEGDTRNIARDIVQRYEGAGYFGKAAKLIRELALGNPHDMDLILRKAIIEEKVGNYEVASRIYLDAFYALLDMPSRDPDTLNSVVSGLVLSARTTQSRKHVLAAVYDRFKDELKMLEKGNSFGERIQDNQRLRTLADVGRRLAVVFHERNYLESIDQEIISRYSGFARTVSDSAFWRRNWGLKRLEIDLLQEHGKPVTFPDNLSNYVHDPVKLQTALSDVRLRNYWIEMLLTTAARLGFNDVLKKMMETVNLVHIPKIDGVPLMSVGIASGDSKFQRDVLFETLSPKRRRYRKPVTGMLRKQIPVVWHLLSPGERQSVVNQYGLKAKPGSYIPAAFFNYLKLESEDRSGMSFVTLKKEAGYSSKIGRLASRRYIPRLEQPDTYAWPALIGWWLGLNEADRAPALKLIVSSMAPGERECILAQFAMLLDDEQINDQLVAEFKRLFQSAYVSFANSDTRRMARPVILALSGYNRNRLTEHIRKNMTEAGHKEIAFDLFTSGFSGIDDDEFLRRSWDAIDFYKAQIKVDPRATFLLHAYVLQPLANRLSLAEMDKVMTRYSNSNDPLDMLIRFLFLRHAGCETEAMEVLIRMRSLPDEDARAALVRDVLPAILVSYGWDAYAHQFMGSGGDPHLSSVVLPYSLYDPLALLANAGPELIDSDERRMLVGTLFQDPSMIHEAGRLYLTDTRHPAFGRVRTMSQRIGLAIGGLREIETRPEGYVLDSLAESEAGILEAYNWLSNHHPRSGDRRVRSVLQRVIKTGISKHGVPEILMGQLNQAASKSMLNAVDISIVKLIAEHDPAQLSKSVANEMPSIILNSGGGQLATYCKFVGMNQYAQGLMRWALVRDIVNKGTSPWLPRYLELLPESDRREQMQALLPLMGLNGIRQDIGGEEATLFDTLLNMDMKPELGHLLDRYLHKLREVSFDGKLQDTVAIALARLGRTDDYRNVVRRRVFLDQYRRKEQYGSSPVGLAADDYSGSLPELNQVTEIGTYIDIHLDTHAWLRKCGMINREAQAAQVCLLSKWCADRGQTKRAEDLLRTAEKLSEGMLAGRLWIADMHRRLGREAPATAIERELLRLELLPVARIPGILKVVATEDGQAKADAIAYRVVAYSNHPELLPLALRHAQGAGLKKEAAELSARIQKIKRLLVGRGVPQKKAEHEKTPE